MCPEHTETFLTLLKDPNHWLFELFLMALFDGLIGMLAWPFVRKHWLEHADNHHDQPTVQELLERIKELERKDDPWHQ
jgi:hypothetical protein